MKILKQKWFWYLVIMPITITSVFWIGIFKTHDYYQNYKAELFNDGYEVGRFDQLNEDAGNTEKDKQDQILKCLASLESSNGKYLKRLDTNNKYSLGFYHFQADTVKDMYWRYYHKKITTDEAIKIAEDYEKSTELARHAIFVKGETYHWLLSMQKLKNAGIIK